MSDYLNVGIYDFKNNISRYIRLLEQGAHKGIIIERHGARVGAFIPLSASKSEDDRARHLQTRCGS
jgi:hypothetical protein